MKEINELKAVATRLQALSEGITEGRKKVKPIKQYNYEAE